MRKLVFFSTFLLSLLYSTNINAQEFKKTLKINGRIQYDYEFLKREKVDDWFNGNEFRRVQLSFSGKISPNIKYKVEFTFPHGEIGFGDVYIKYTTKKFGNFAIGSLPEPNGLSIMTSSKYIPMFERPMLTTLQNNKWGSGLHYENFALFNSKAGLQMSLTNNGSVKEGFKDKNLEKGQNFTARFFVAPFYNKDNRSLLHLGINYASRPYKELKFRPENHMGEKYTYEFPDGKRRIALGFEVAGNYQSFSLQGEFKNMSVVNEIDKDYKMTGYYVMGSYFITGENRPYTKGVFGRVKPRKDINNGGYGAFEILARFSNMTATDDVVAVNPGNPDQINNISFGLNWYLTSHARITYNYIITDDNNDVLGNLSGHLIRAQVDF